MNNDGRYENIGGYSPPLEGGVRGGIKVVEVDGGQHADNKTDMIRDQWLKERGYKVLRFWNNEVLGNREGVLEKINDFLNHPLPNPPLKGEGIQLKSA